MSFDGVLPGVDFRNLLNQAAAEFDRLYAENVALRHRVQLAERLAEQRAAEPGQLRSSDRRAQSLPGVIPEEGSISNYKIYSQQPTTASKARRSREERVVIPKPGRSFEDLASVVSPVPSRMSAPTPVSTSCSSAAHEDEVCSSSKLKEEFRGVCQPGRTTITATHLCHMQAEHSQREDFQDLDVDGETNKAQLYRAAIMAFNAAAEVQLQPWDPKDEIHPETYCSLMRMREEDFPALAEENDISEEQVAALLDARRLLLSQSAAQAVALATAASTKDLLRAEAEGRTRAIDLALKYLEPIIGVVILFNALVIGLSCDYSPDWIGWAYIETVFCVIYIAEIVLKTGAVGCKAHFLGRDWAWNWFDAFVALIATVDLVFKIIGGLSGLSSITVVRIARLARITKLVRVLRLHVFKELTLMVNGCIAGLRTLFWAIVFLGFFIYCLGVLLQQVVGQEKTEWCSGGGGHDAAGSGDGLGLVGGECRDSQRHIQSYRQQLFGTVGRSMITVFRCYTDGCSSVDGTPLIVHIWNVYGPWAVSCYVLCTLFVIFGIFNLVAAIFVENTIEYAKHDEEKRRAFRRSEKLRVARKLQQLVAMLMTNKDVFLRSTMNRRRSSNTIAELRRGLWERFHSWVVCSLGTAVSLQRKGEPAPAEPPADAASLTSVTFAFSSARVTRRSFEQIVATPDAKALLEDLDVQIADQDTLFDVLDCEGHGTLGVQDLVQGLLKLRGPVQKSDNVETVLATRSMQKSMRAMEVAFMQQQKATADLLKQVQQSLKHQPSRPQAVEGSGSRF